MANCTPAQIEEITRHIRTVVETVVMQQNLNILFEDLTDMDDNEFEPMFVVTFNAPRQHRPEATIPHHKQDNDVPF